MVQSRLRTVSPVPQAPSAVHLGDLARSDRTWRVYLESRPEGQSFAGRLHFVDGETLRSTTWIFLEWHERDLVNRFYEFSPVELWKLVESLG